jgi:iron complex transport system substrate-binding protein
VPGGKSTMGQMYSDAGADYLFADYDVNGSVPLSVEVVLDKTADADMWLLKYNSSVDKSCSDLLEEYDGYIHFKPFRERNVYACNTHKKNVFEESAFHPERLLKDLIALFHPYLFPEYKAVYYEKMR